jgi:PAS domain S-box-containing protein
MTRMLAWGGWAPAVLLLSLGVTLLAWRVSVGRERGERRLVFQRQALRGSAAVEDHLMDCEALLKAARGLFAASDRVTAADWASFVETLELSTHNPAVVGLGYVELDARRGADPEGAGESGGRVVRYYGPDEQAPLPVRWQAPELAEAMNRARDTGEAAMTTVLGLGDGAGEPRLGYAVVWMPVYGGRGPALDIASRRARIAGWIAAVMRVETIAQDVVHRTLAEGVGLQLSEQLPGGAERVIAEGPADGHARDVRDNASVSFGGQRWGMCFSAGDSFKVVGSGDLPVLTLVSGGALSVLLAAIVAALTRTGRLAAGLAREMTASLRESEARFDAAISAARQVYYDWDPRLGTVTMKGCVRELLGAEAGAITTLEQWIELVHPEDRETVRRECDRVVQTKEPLSLEYRMRRSDGSYATVHDSGCFFREAGGEVARMVGFAIDVTERRRAEEERRRSDERFRVVFERSGVPLLLLSEGRVVDCNAAAVRMLGAAGKQELVGLRPHELSPEIQPDGRASAERMDSVLTQLESGADGELSVEWTCQRRTGETFVVQAVFSVVQLGESALVMAGWHDLTEVRRAEQERRRVQRVLQIAVDAMPQRVYWKDKGGVYVGCNQAFAHDAGVGAPEGIVGKTDFDLAWRAQAHGRRADDFEVMAGGRALVNVQERTTVARGGERWVRSTKVPLHDETGRTIGVLGTFEDVTEERAAKDELRRARDAAEAASQAKSEFLANMSHEIRTPMTAILGYADLLGEPGVDTGERARCVRTIRSNGEHLLTIINDILDLSKIEAGKMHLERVAVSPAVVMREALSLVRPRADAKGLRLEATFLTKVPREIVSDPTRIRQMLVNLLGNAVKFTEAGSVEARVSYEPPARGTPARLRMDVVDTGIGMSEEVLSRLFQPFTQADSSVTRRFGGTGLGLTVTRRLAHLLGGEVEAQSTPGKGSTFSLRVPLGLREPPELVEAGRDGDSDHVAPQVRAVRLEGRILLVEDGADNQRLIAHMLRTAGAEVEIAEHGAAALERLARPHAAGAAVYDMVLMDMQMPVLDGYSATRELRARGHRLPIVALTAHAMTGERERCLAAGCDDYSTKPVKRDRLVALCAAWIAAGRERRGVEPSTAAAGPA